MKKLLFRAAIISLALGPLASASDAALSLVAGWDFTNDNTLPVDASSKDQVYNSISGTPTLDKSGGQATAQIVTTAPGSFSLSFSGNHADYLNGTVLTFNFSSTGAADIQAISVAYSVSTFANLSQVTGTWSYQINGTGGFSQAGERTLSGTGGATDSLGINLTAGDTLAIRYTLTGASGGNNGNIAFDDFTFNASAIAPVPEPIHYALVGFGGLFALIRFGRAYLVRPPA